MKKSHGPDLRRQVIALKQCQTCRGRAVVRGVFYEMECASCNASGWVRADNGEALELRELVIQLSFNLRQARQQLQQRGTDTATQYQQSNRRGAGGSHYSGD